MMPKLQLDLGPRSPWGKVVRAVARARAELLAEIAARRAEPAGGQDILALLLAAHNEDGSALGDDEIVDEMMTMVAAGHETTAMALTWLAYAVYTRPSVLATLRAEAKTGAPLAERPYLQAVVRESLRFYSVIPSGSGRIAKRAFQLGGYDVPAHAMVTVAFDAVHRKLEVFADAATFRPDRFIGAKLSPYEWIPFGGGTRRCLGMPSALFELQLVLAELVAGYDVRVVQRVVKPMWRGRFLTPTKGLIVRVSHR
jgi:cytochrome P450